MTTSSPTESAREDGNVRDQPYRLAVNEVLREEMARDPTVIIMGEDIAGGAGRQHMGIVDAWGGAFSKYKGLITEFGEERVRDCPISEMGFVGAGVGAALTGLRPVVEIMFVDFIGMCLDQVMNQAAFSRYMFGGKTKVPLTLVTQIGAGTGYGSQHSKVLYSMFAHIPGLKCVAPSDAYNAKGLYLSAIRDDNPVVIFDHKLLLGKSWPVPEGEYTLPIGKAHVARQGTTVTLIGVSYTTQVCLEAATRLADEGIDAEVVDLLSLAPLDEETILESVSRTNHVVIVDEDFPRCGIASEVSSVIAEKALDDLDAPIRKVTPPNTPVPFSPVLERTYMPDVDDVMQAAKDVLR